MNRTSACVTVPSVTLNMMVNASELPDMSESGIGVLSCISDQTGMPCTVRLFE